MTVGNLLSVGHLVRAYVKLGPLVSFLLLLCSQGIARQDQNTTAFRLNKIEIVGLQKVSRENFLELSGLQLDQSLKLADLQAVTDKLYSSNLFAKIRYRYSWTGVQLDLVFEVEEASIDPPQTSSPSTEKPLILGKIEFSGLQRCDRTTAIQATMLQVGAQFEQKQLNDAAKKLAGTGYFSEINYNYRKENDRAVALFEVVEFKWDVPCIFDNFVWFTTQELHEAVRKKIPTFEGTSPDDEAIPSAIKTVLEQLLRQHRINRGVNFIISMGNLEDPAAKAKKEFHFLTTGAPMPVCQVIFPGSSATIEKQFQSAIKPLLNVDYSNRQISQYVENMLMPIYRQRGYLRVKFADPMAQPDRVANKKCQNGVNVSVPVIEGAVYKLGKFEWDGNQSIALSTMQDLFGMKAGATADGAKIDRGLNAIKTAYLNQGYLDHKLETKTDFDDSSRTANYRITVNEGQLFRMGEVIIANASESEQKRIRGRWQLAPGAVLNFGYVREFVKKISEDRSGRMPRVNLQIDRAKQTADVLFTF